MTAAWIARLPLAQARHLARMRNVPDLELAQTAANVWLRGEHFTGAIEQALRTVPEVELFWLREGALWSLGARLPSEHLPTGLTWTPAAASLPIALPGAKRRGSAPAPRPIQLVRSAVEVPANATITTVPRWLEYAESAPLIRLQQLRFAAARDGRVLILGQPLPRVQGDPFVEQHGIVIPCGFAWQPAVDADVLRAAYQLSDDDVLLLDTQSAVRIPQDAFVAATRAAVRSTARHYDHA